MGAVAIDQFTNEDTSTKQYFHKHRLFTYTFKLLVIKLTRAYASGLSFLVSKHGGQTIISTNFYCFQNIY